jgi:CheY-like chemotaxis protein
LLLIEDHVDLANTTAEYLGLFGLNVQIASTGYQALEAATAFQPQIVLCDLSLPDMSGLEVVRRLRADPNTKNALLVVCTAISQTDLGAFEEELAGAVDLFLTKPITNDDVNELLHRLAMRPNQLAR